ncbi:hypothetical protein ACLBXJ_15620 [Methylobacterium mesophilicum]
MEAPPRERVRPPAAGTGIIEPDAAVNFWFDCLGAVTLEFAPVEDEPVLVVDDDGEAVPSQAILVTIYVQRVKDATITWPAGIRWAADLKGAPGSAATGATLDVFTLQMVPGKGWFGYVAGMGMA